nr:recombinase family protein [Pseudomonas fluorescens]
MQSSTKRAKVYSYLRFSDPKQALGNSADRQLQYAETWAKKKGLVLDDSLSLRDEGLSAYHQRHVTQGALGVFLRAVEDGRIKDGSVLIVEGLDRLSRAEPIQAQAQLAQIINAGITVVTASDGREYNRAGLKAQPMDLVYSLLVMIRAHEESDTKSKRVKAAIVGCTVLLTVKTAGAPPVEAAALFQWNRRCSSFALISSTCSD